MEWGREGADPASNEKTMNTNLREIFKFKKRRNDEAACKS